MAFLVYFLITFLRTQNLKLFFISTSGNYGAGGSVIEEEDSSDEDEPLAATKKRITKKPMGAGGDGVETPQLPSSQLSGISVTGDADMLAKKLKVCTKADQLTEIAEHQKKDNILDHALSIIEGGNSTLKLSTSAIASLLEKINGKAHQCCMMQVQQLIMNHFCPPRKTAMQPGFEETVHAPPEEDFPRHVRYVKVPATESHALIMFHGNDNFDLNGHSQMQQQTFSISFQWVSFSPVIMQYADVIAVSCPGTIKKPYLNTRAFPTV